MTEFEAGRLTREAELLFRIEPLLRNAKIDQSDPENEEIMKAYYDGMVIAYETAIAFIKGETE